jgi:hypothetical protein
MGWVMAGDGRRLQWSKDQLGLRGQQHAQQDRQRQHPLLQWHMRHDVIHQMSRGLRHAARAARRTEPAALAAEGQQLVVAALAAARAVEPMRQDAALEVGLELVLDEAWQIRSGAGRGVRDEAGRVLLDQAMQRGLLAAVALVAERRAVRRPAEAAGQVASTMAPEGVGPNGLRPCFSPQSLRGLPADVCPPLWGLHVPFCGFDRQLCGGEIRTADVSPGSDAPGDEGLLPGSTSSKAAVRR